MSAALDILFPHAQDTRGIVVRVAPSYLPEQSEPERGRWFWAYHIRIENRSDHLVQLISRRWIITDGHGQRHRVEGEGVVGAQPMIGPGESYDYVSGCPLETHSGSMEGSYRMISETTDAFDAAIPRFPLIGPPVGGR